MGTSNGHIYHGQFIQPIKVRISDKVQNQQDSYDYEKIFGKVDTTRAVDGSNISNTNLQQHNPNSQANQYNLQKKHFQKKNDCRQRDKNFSKYAKDSSSYLCKSNITNINYKEKKFKKCQNVQQRQTIMPQTHQQVQQSREKISRDVKTQKKYRKENNLSKSFLGMQSQSILENKVSKKEYTHNKISQLERELRTLREIINEQKNIKQMKSTEIKRIVDRSQHNNFQPLLTRKSQKSKIKSIETEVDQYYVDNQSLSKRKCLSTISNINSYSGHESRNTLQQNPLVLKINKQSLSQSYNLNFSAAQNNLNNVDFSSVQPIRTEQIVKQSQSEHLFIKKPSVYFQAANSLQENINLKYQKVDGKNKSSLFGQNI